jgi:hypothetical protein
MMNRRASKFMNIINEDTNEVTFLYRINHIKFENNPQLYNDMYAFDNNKNIKCKFKVLVYLYNNDYDFEFNIPEHFYKLKNFIFTKYILNTCVSPVYGDAKDFKQMLSSNNLI